MAAPIPILLMVRQLGWGGTERQMTELAKALDRSRFIPHAAAFRACGERADELRRCGIPVVEFAVNSLIKPGALKAARELRAYLRRHSIAVVHTFDYPANIWAVPAAKLAGTPVVLASQRGHRYNYLPKYRALLRLSDVFADGIVVNCEAMRRHLQTDHSVPGHKIRLCHNGINTAEFRPGPRLRPAILDGAGPVIGTVAVLRREKGIPVLLEAFAAAVARRPGCRLVIVGSGPEEGALRDAARGLGIERAVRFEPAAANVAEWLHVFDMFVLPSLNEALSNSLMEAMACGCAVIASNVGGNPELVTDGQNGLLFDCGDAAGLAGKLLALIDNPELRTSLAAAASRSIAGGFTIEASAACMGRIYSEFLDRRRARLR